MRGREEGRVLQGDTRAGADAGPWEESAQFGMVGAWTTQGHWSNKMRGRQSARPCPLVQTLQ